MSRPQTYEQSVLSKVDSILQNYSDQYKDRLLVIEACAAIYGQFKVEEYWLTFNIKPQNIEKVKETANKLFLEINALGISPSMVLSSLAREPITVSEKKQQGAFYTDYRLASFVASECEKHLKKGSRVADLAVGSGILLAGIADQYYKKHPNSYDSWIASCLFAYDLSSNALRGARAAISVHSSSIEAIKQMNLNWRVCDSLFSAELQDSSFDIIVGNPPWGKVKLSLHSFVNSTGFNHVYGSAIREYDHEMYQENRDNLQAYSNNLKEIYKLLGNAEPDMYMAFLQRTMSAIKPDGHLVFIIPAGLIRSQGTEQLRRLIFNQSKEISFYLFDNKPRFFEIDSRFKFLVLSHHKAKKKSDVCSAFSLMMCAGTKEGISVGEEIVYNIQELEKIRPDLTVPECRSSKEKDLFFKICQNGTSWKEKWGVEVTREVDMTNNRSDFQTSPSHDLIPVIEGRMVQQFRFGAKAYVSGSGRSARWIPSVGNLCPQFYIDANNLSPQLKQRVSLMRVGYCDIAGQTNERAMTSAIIPPNVICGNKVPTITFNGSYADEYMYLWLGVTNSFVFDWVVRRIISTTVNYFLLFSLPMPVLDIESDIAKHIILKSQLLSNMGEEFYTENSMAVIRAELDVLVAKAFNLSFTDLELIMQDFPLLDRAQIPLENESRSSITKDLVLSIAETLLCGEAGHYTDRYNRDILTGSKAYIPTEMSVLCRKERIT